jgi:hypothetical protein
VGIVSKVRLSSQSMAMVIWAGSEMWQTRLVPANSSIVCVVFDILRARNLGTSQPFQEDADNEHELSLPPRALDNLKNSMVHNALSWRNINAAFLFFLTLTFLFLGKLGFSCISSKGSGQRSGR